MADGEPSRFRVFCNHCDDYIPKSTFYRHKETFFNPVSNSWHKKGGETSPRANRTSRTRDRSRLVDEPSNTDSSDDDVGYGQELEAGTIEDPECKDERDTRFILYLVTFKVPSLSINKYIYNYVMCKYTDEHVVCT